jgi:hypothetical protein
VIDHAALKVATDDPARLGAGGAVMLGRDRAEPRVSSAGILRLKARNVSRSSVFIHAS